MNAPTSTTTSTTARQICECCEARGVVAVIGLPGGEQAGLCGGCLDDAVELGLVQLTAPAAPGVDGTPGGVR